MIHVYVTHHVTGAVEGINDILIDQLYRMRSEVISVGGRLLVVYWTNDPNYVDELKRRVPSGIELVANDRSGRADTQPSLRNKIIDHARASDCEAFTLLHNDVRLARGSLAHLVKDFRKAEKRHGRANVIISPRYIPYHLTVPHPAAVTRSAFWEAMHSNPNVKSADQMLVWCQPWGWKLDHDQEVICPKKSSTTDDGHMLMMFMASPHFFDDVGGCDESFTGLNFDDSDWGIRALMRGKRNLQSTGALVGHVGGLTFGTVVYTEEWQRKASDNAQLFINKWGRPLFDEMQTGRLWIRLHREQGSEGEVHS